MDLMDRVFWGMIGFIGIHFLWLGAIEEYVSLYVGTAIAAVFLVWFIGWGYRWLPLRTDTEQ